ncbi:hypothetical protein LEP1GSC034_4439 [Leptospira interrogans str. 2003000735]|uniref:Uncharacterized protein n=3 Tax=Leptospira interrogans TaxID=173 RepID=M6KB48_LEPIR|nr:hypothetical protein LEP1GSC069_3971 [Leptospira interrogans serovar Canicola str. Fiocruz LV133]EMJ67387.1 hypothetical protein LEP1GSC034_4439 [Leptospira interrogans str. 2003000735]EMN29000.1 hypothetical protein LEP1GSC083_4341 [Leptospira interrogans serovar Pyrogenes str. L0374]EMN68563.1 hypothetical protein LEP1GSC098_2379 [Leptospira interrogans serovar Grippotyphosa str. UI 08434]EMN73809.1 hypothetical protein LEP1GSC100_3053 [Leptospira interrogans serovar Bataviae str. UI 08561
MFFHLNVSFSLNIKNNNIKLLYYSETILMILKTKSIVSLLELLKN